MQIAQAQMHHLDQMCRIMDQAKARMRCMGLNQWQNGYPSREIWVDDIESGRAFVVIDSEGSVLGQFVYQTEPEASYERIEGAWLSDSAYACMHRVCVSDAAAGKGLAARMFAFACDRARNEGFASVRIDTHADNVPMKRALEKACFERCGIIELVGGVESGAKRDAFEKLL